MPVATIEERSMNMNIGPKMTMVSAKSKISTKALLIIAVVYAIMIAICISTAFFYSQQVEVAESVHFSVVYGGCDEG